MELISVVLCEAANTTHDGRFNILGGGLERLFAPKFPVTGKLTMVMRIEIHPAEFGTHKITVILMDSDGKKVVPPLEMNIEFPKGARFVNSILDIGNITLNNPGTYSFEILFDGQHKRSWTIEAMHAPPPKQKESS